MSLTYFPVVTGYDQNIFENNVHCFINPVWSPPTPEMLQQLSVYPYLLCDNGAYEMFKIMNRNRNGKKSERFFVIPGGGIYQNKDGLHLDPFELCKAFGRLKVKCGFTLDFPLVDGSAEEYSDHLYKSYENAETMFDLRTKFCPGTDLLIPLHFSTKDQLHDYFSNMSVLDPDGYAFPVRERTTRGYLMRIAYTLTFLHSEGIKRVHLLGSSKPEIIIICAAALGLGMFDHITFDSSTWRTTRNLIAKILDPETLKQKDIRDLEDFSALLDKDSVVGIIGPGGIGKTMYALEISVRLLSGKQIPKWPKVKKFPKKVKFFTNDPEYETRRRIEGISKSLGVNDPNNLILDRPFDLNPMFDYKNPNINQSRVITGQGQYIVDESEDVDLFIFDTLKNFHSVDENSNTAMGLVMKNIMLFAREAGPVIITHHTTGASYFDSRAGSRGATVIPDEMHSILDIKESDLSTADLGLFWTKAKFRIRRPKSFHANRKNFLIKPADSLPDYLKRLNGIQTGNKIIGLIMKYSKVGNSKAFEIRNDLLKTGKIKKIRKNQYEIVQ